MGPKKPEKDIIDLTDEHEVKSSKPLRKKWLNPLTGVLIIILLTPLFFYGYLFAVTPNVIRNPLLEHLHFRLQVIVDGQSVDFSEAKFQIPYDKNQCGVDLPNEPVHFHDDRDQLVHIHWEDITGGIVLKYFGWNMIGGPDSSLGLKKNGTFNYEKVPIYGAFLPEISNDENFYIYSGNENEYIERSLDDFKNLDLETFFDKQSNFPDQVATSFIDLFFPKVAAHDVEDDPGIHSRSSDETEEQRLLRVNNLIGNVVVFVQQDPPSNEEIVNRFNNLEPLTESTCGG